MIFNMKKLIYIIFVLIICICCKEPDKSKLGTFDYRLFRGSQGETLALAVKHGDTDAIIREVKDKHVPVDIRDEMYGTTPLMIAVWCNNIKSTKCLLELGADPNLHQDTLKTTGNNTVIMACRSKSISPEILKLLLSFGGDPDSQTKGLQKENNGELRPRRDYALHPAAATDIEKV